MRPTPVTGPALTTLSTQPMTKQALCLVAPSAGQPVQGAPWLGWAELGVGLTGFRGVMTNSPECDACAANV